MSVRTLLSSRSDWPGMEDSSPRGGVLDEPDEQRQHHSTNLHHRDRRHVRKRNRISRSAVKDQQQNNHSLVDFEKHIMMGLTIAGVASSLLTTTYGVFHVDIFLQAYHLPLASYSFGSFIFSIVNTANDLAGAWIVDHIATRRKRTDLVGVAGILFALCFLTPFFRWQHIEKDASEDGVERSSNSFWDLAHFVVSLSLYDTMFSFTAILMGSVVTDNHHMTDKERQAFMASGKVANLFASFAVARLGLSLFDVTNLSHFRFFLLILSLVATVMFLVGQAMIHGYSPFSFAGEDSLCKQLPFISRDWRNSRSRRRRNRLQAENEGVSPSHRELSKSASQATNDTIAVATGKLQFRQVVKDFWSHKNFRAWIGMELLLEAQMTFCSHFLKTFVDKLLREGSLSPSSCDWFISIHRPLGQIASIAMYIPIRHFGYPVLYKFVFVTNIVLSTLVWLFADATSTIWIMVYLLLYPVITGAIQSAGFHLAMSDMVMELKRDHALAGRFGEPSLAGLFMGANALVCKPAESLLPIVAATVLDRRGNTAETLFSLLVLPPLLFSVLQLASWTYYDLSPKRTARIREELKDLLLEGATGELQLPESCSREDPNGSFFDLMDASYSM